MLVAEPCDWTDWPDQPPSRLSVWRKAEDAWIFVSHIGPWMAPGVMWEVPVLVDFGERQALLLSIIDRRQGRADCAVRYWLGRFDGASFETSSPQEGLRLDHGPDFYAAIVAVTEPADRPEHILVAWASNWATARTMSWPGIHGGPITLPRRLTLDPGAGRLVQSPAPELAPERSWTWCAGQDLTVELTGEDCRLTVQLDDAGISVARRGCGGLLDWERREVLAITGRQTVDLYRDAGLIELFVLPAGLTVTAFLPGARL